LPLGAQEPFGTTDPFASRMKAKSNFQIKFKVPERGGEVHLSTRQPVHYEKDVFWEGSEDVEIEYQDVKIRADKGRYDFATKTATLEGNVIIDQGPSRMAGSSGTFQLEAKTGRLEDASADLAPTYHIIAEWLEKIGEATYRVHHGVFTACDVPDPAWSFYLSEATVTLDDYARMKDVSFRIGTVPLLYSPYLIWPTKEDRASGFLVPGVGYNGKRGAYLGLTYYWVRGIGLEPVLYSSGPTAPRELRWAPSLESAGIFRVTRSTTGTRPCACRLRRCLQAAAGRARWQRIAGVFTTQTLNRWKVRLDQISDDLPYGFRGVLAIRDYSDDQYLQDIERSFALSSASQIISRGFLTKNFGDNSVNLRVERSQSFFGTTVLQERLPSLEFFHRTSRIGSSPVFLSLESSLSYLYINRGTGLPRGTYGRGDFHPGFSLPWKSIPWLSVTARLGARWTGYTDSTDEAQTHFVGESFSRRYGEAGLSIVGPSFSRIFDAEIGRFGKFKHHRAPIDYTYVSDVSDPARLPTYIVDPALGQNQVRHAIVNRLAPGGPDEGSAEEIASLEGPADPRVPAAAEPVDLGHRVPDGGDEGRPRGGDAASLAREHPAFRRPHGLRHARLAVDRGVGDGLGLMEDQLRQCHVVREPAGAGDAAPGGIRLAQHRPDAPRGRDRPVEGGAHRHPVELRRPQGSAPRGPLPDRVQGLVLHGLSGGPAAPKTRRDYRFVINLNIGTLLDVSGSLTGFGPETPDGWTVAILPCQ
jgi:hypothetical protein